MPCHASLQCCINLDKFMYWTNFFWKVMPSVVGNVLKLFLLITPALILS